MSCTITGCRCYHKGMHEVIWSNHNIIKLSLPLHLSSLSSSSLCDPTALLSVLCSNIPLLQSEKPDKLIKIPSCKTIPAQERRPVSLTLAFTLFWGRAQAQRRRELQRSLMCTGLFWEWALRHDASTERDNRWQHLKPRNQPGLTIRLWVSSFSSSPSIHLFLCLLLSTTAAQEFKLLSFKDQGPICVELTWFPCLCGTSPTYKRPGRSLRDANCP